jgi:hypothetical protein
MRQYNEWPFSTDPIRRMREMTIFLENALISQRYATTSNLSELERGLSSDQYLRQLERIACRRVSVDEYMSKSERPVPIIAYSPIMPM